MKVLLVFLVFFLCSYYSNAQMQEEGSTTTTVIDSQGGVEEITETTVTIENKTTGDILDGDTGIVSSRYEGDMDLDWGGIGSASMPNCPSQFSNGGRCAKGTSNSLTTFQQNINIAQFHIEDGGALNWSLDGWHSQANTSMYFELKGYNDNVLLWTDKTNFAYNNYTDNTAYNYAGQYDYSGGLDKLFVSVGGAKNYYFDNVQLDVGYNVISTTVEIWLQLVAQQQDLDIIIDPPIDTYEPINNNIIDAPIIDNYTSDPPIDNYTDDPPIVEYTMDSGITELDMPSDIPMLDIPMLDISPHQYEEIIVELDTSLEEVANTIEAPVVVDNLPKEPPAIENTPKETVNEEIKEPINAPAEPVEEVEDSKPTPETASNEEIVEEVKEEPKEIVEEVTEEVKEDVKEESKPEEKEIVEEKPKKEEEVKEVKVEDKPTKKQEAKQEKAKEIMQSFESQYDAVAQLTTLALVNALGADIKTYSQIKIQAQPIWYESKDIYSNVVLQDPLGNYFGVRDSLVFEQMIGSQYE